MAGTFVENIDAICATFLVVVQERARNEILVVYGKALGYEFVVAVRMVWIGVAGG
jgi:hypothetical protein